MISYYWDSYNENAHPEKIRTLGENVEKLEPLNIAGGHVKWFSCYTKQYDSF
jgi:hypothetical protein